MGFQDIGGLRMWGNPRRLPGRSRNGPEGGSKVRRVIQWKKQLIKMPRRMQVLLLIRNRGGDCDKQVTNEVIS